jgi:MFS family permease
MDIFFKTKNKKCQFTSSFISAVFYQLGFEIVMVLCNFTVYFLSYIRYEQTWVDMFYGNLMRPVVLFFLSLFSPLSGTMETCFGTRIATIISAIIIEICFLFLYLQRNLWIFYSLILLMGIGYGLSTQMLTKNLCYYYPKHKGFISSLIASTGTLFGSVYSYFGELFINPERELVIDPQKAPYYSEEIAEKSRYLFLFALIIMPASTIFSMFLFYKYHPENIEKETEKIEGSIIEEANGDKKTNSEQENETPGYNRSDSFSKASTKRDIKYVLTHFRFWRNILIVGAMPFIIWFETSTSRAFSVTIGVDGRIIGILSSSISIMSCIANPIWALCVDKFGFRPIMIIISSITTALSIYLSIFIDNPILYVIGIYVSNLLRGGIIAALVPHMMEVFGIKYFLTLGGLGRLFTQLFSFGVSGISIIISIFRKGRDELIFPYRIVCVASIGFSVFGLFLSFYENDEKFKFKDIEMEDENNNDEDNINTNPKILGGEIGNEDEDED